MHFIERVHSFDKIFLKIHDPKTVTALGSSSEPNGLRYDQRSLLLSLTKYSRHQD